MNTLLRCRSAVCCLSLLASALLAVSPAMAAEPAFMEGPGIAVTAADVEADLLRVPPEARQAMRAQAQTVGQVASNLYVRRALADKAQAEGLAADPIVQAQLQQMRDRVLSEALLARVDEGVTPNKAVLESAARNTYNADPSRYKVGEQVRVRHILVSGADANAKGKAEALLEQLKGGADFAVLAQAESADKGSGAKGGDLGFFERGRMVPDFENAAFALQKRGDLSPVVATQFGYHILQLEERRAPNVRAFDEVRETLVADALKTIRQDARVAAAHDVRQGAKVNNEAIEAFSKRAR